MHCTMKYLVCASINVMKCLLPCLETGIIVPHTSEDICDAISVSCSAFWWGWRLALPVANELHVILGGVCCRS